MGNRGIFITFEGGEGSGKSTQIALLETFLGDQGIQCLRTREPGGSSGAELIRNLILQGDVARWDALTEYLLFSAARRDHLTRTIEPALAQGIWVICDRYIDSSRVYQGVVQNLPTEIIESIYHAISNGLEPDLTLVLDIPVKDGLNRAEKRKSIENRFENKGEAFHEHVRQAFLDLARQNPGRCHILDADMPIGDLQHLIQKYISDRFLLKGV